jgi:integrase
MARPATGTMETAELADGTRSFRIRVRGGEPRQRPRVTLHERKGCDCCDGGGWDERSAEIRLEDILAEIRVGVFEPPEKKVRATSSPEENGSPLTYAAFGEWVIAGKVSGELSERGPISPNTEKDYRWRLGYSEAYFGEAPIIDLSRARSLGFLRHLFQTAAAERKAIEAGAVLRDRQGRRRFPLSLSSIKKIVDFYASVLQEAVEEEIRDDNPGRSRRMRVRVPKPKRTYLEIDELGALLKAASDQEIALPSVISAKGQTGTNSAVARLAASGKPPKAIASELGIAKSTVSYHLRKLNIKVERGYVGRRMVCELLGRGGLRASEVCDLRIRSLRLHHPGGARVSIEDAKTEAGERTVALSPDGTEVAIKHLDRLRRAGLPTGPDDYLVPNTRGGRMTRQRVGKIVAEAANLASERLQALGLPPLPRTTPHTLRRTFISIALLVSNFDLKWVMDQVGHAYATMTMDVYAQLQQRLERQHGAKFDRLVREAQRQVAIPESIGTPSFAADDGGVLLAAAA